MLFAKTDNMRKAKSYKTIIRAGTLTLVCFLISLQTWSQQLPVYSQYTFNAFLLNPAVAGAEGYTAFNSTTRQQWVGVEGAPVTYCLSLQSRLMKNRNIKSSASARRRYQPLRSGRVGLGAYIYRDHIGLLDQTGAEFTYAYHIGNEKSQLSMGVTVSLFQFRLNEDELRLPDPKDNLISNQPMNMIIPDANLGIYYTNQYMFLGFSMFHLSEASIMFGPYSNTNYRLERQYNTTAGFQVALNELYTIEPSCYLKISEQWKLQGDFVAKVIYDRKFWMGIGIRNPNIFIGLVGFKINRFYLGYAYDYNSNPLTTYSNGTHELMLSLKLGDNVRRYKWMERY
jgi:type IX secretion system PorP/SprF family membrane protein